MTGSPSMTDATLSALPIELLSRIFHQLIDKWKDHHVNLAPLPQVCRQWYRVATPILYSRVHNSLDSDTETAYQERFFQTLHRNPVFYSYIRDVRISRLGTHVSATLELLDRSSRNIKMLSISGIHNKADKDRVMSSFGNFQLQTLHTSGDLCERMIKSLLDEGRASSLHALEISLDYEERSLTAFTLPREKRYTLPLKKLRVELGACTIDPLRHLLSWPRSLKSVHLDASSSCRDWSPRTDACSTSAMQEALNLQCESLEEIKLSVSHPDHHGYLVDLSAFENVTTLSLHWDSVFRTTVEEASQRLSCPKLKRLTIDMEWMDQQHMGYTELKAEGLDHLTGVMQRRRDLLSVDLMDEIHIVFKWSEVSIYEDYIWPSIGCFEWPHQHLEAVRERLEPLGLRVTWSKPHWTKEEWEIKVREEKAKMDKEAEEAERKATEELRKEGGSLDGAGDEILTAVDGSEQWRRKICEYCLPECRLHRIVKNSSGTTLGIQ